jgi:hypothetical protein
VLRIVSIVEGDGEVRAVPVAIRRIAIEILGRYDILVESPIRVRRDRFLNRPDEQRRALFLAAAKAGNDGAILILMDSDRDCAAELAGQILSAASREIAHIRCQCVFAVREFESWFLAAAFSLRGVRGFSVDLAAPPNSEDIQDAKGWLAERRTPARYAPTIDQPALAAIFSLELARHASPSFDKFVRDIQALSN